MRWTKTVALLLFVFAASIGAAPPTPDAAKLTALLHEFLAGASRNDVSVHERMWADDLIYTRSAGVRIGKADILKDVRSAPPARPEDPKTIYTAEDIRIQQYDHAALVAFRLVATTTAADSTSVAQFLNTGFFIRREGNWQAVGWQATRIP
jgi:hypothetical protein